MTVFGDDPLKHRLLTAHYSAEFCEKTEGRGRTVWEWRASPGLDNHWLDAGVGCLAAAALGGCRLGENRPALKKRPSTIELAGFRT